MLTDTHCHLDFNKFDEDREAVIQRAFEAGVERILIPALELKSCQAVDSAGKFTLDSVCRCRLPPYRFGQLER